MRLPEGIIHEAQITHYLLFVFILVHELLGGVYKPRPLWRSWNCTITAILFIVEKLVIGQDEQGGFLTIY